MSCPVCESNQLTEDDATGQLICGDCGTATGIFHGLTQSQDYSGVRGLRVVYKLESNKSVVATGGSEIHGSSQQLHDRSSFGVSNHLSKGMLMSLKDTAALVGFDSILNCTPSTSKNHIQSADSVEVVNDNIEIPDEVDFHYKVDEDNMSIEWMENKLRRKKEEKSRPWRLSEPFTCIMKRQTECLSQELMIDAESKKLLSDTIWHLWLQYLAITGELGIDAWLTAALQLAKSLGRMFRSRCGSNKMKIESGKVPSHKTKSRGDLGLLDKEEWKFIESHLRQYYWIGWGTLYEPDEGREVLEHLNLPSQDILETLIKTSRNAKKWPSKTRKPRKRKISQNSELIAPATFDVCSDNEETSKLVATPLSPMNAYLPKNCQTSEPDIECDRNSDISCSTHHSEVTVLRKSLVKKILGSNATRRMFWRGYTHDRLHSQALLEHNLAILFIACLTVVPTRPCPVYTFNSQWHQHQEVTVDNGECSVALTALVTLKDLQELCANRCLPFISIEQCLPDGVFKIHDSTLKSLFRRHQAPDIEQLTHATIQMLEFCGLHSLPKFPLGWLVYRHLISLGLPKITHKLARLFLQTLRTKSHASQNLNSPVLTKWIPWSRAVRPEVFAMAAVVIVLRIMFKCDDTYEYRLSHLAKTFGSFPGPPIENDQSANEVQQSIFSKPFVWTDWVSYVNSRFLRGTKMTNKNLTKINEHGNSRMKIPTVVDQTLLSTATSRLDLVNLERTTDFLGSAEFRVGRDIGWGEAYCKPSKISDVTTKLCMSGPLRVLFDTQQQDSESKMSNIQLNGETSSDHCNNNFILHNQLLNTKFEKDGLSSSFIDAQLNFLYDDENTQILTDILSNRSNSITCDEEQYDLLKTWWLDLLQRKMDYYAICTGEWSVLHNYFRKIAKNRHRATKAFILPKPVENLIYSHNQNLANEFSSLIKDETHENDENEEDLYRGYWDNSELLNIESQSVSTKKQPICAHCQPPSDSMKWLVDVCTHVCGALNTKSLLLEIECLERILDWSAPICCSKVKVEDRIRRADYALLSCFDLNDNLYTACNIMK